MSSLHTAIPTPSFCSFWHGHPYIPIHFLKMFFILYIFSPRDKAMQTNYFICSSRSKCLVPDTCTLNTSEGLHVYLVSLTTDETCMQLAYLPGNDRVIPQSAMGKAECDSNRISVYPMSCSLTLLQYKCFHTSTYMYFFYSNSLCQSPGYTHS